ncbi:acyltransferase family protein [Pseudonocardia broussonetiae]|uniref:Acyltransferase n=1 Tax=Pseudonocardia broussonetiae TaxID=2736640 RepID=A0A6M6JRX5_9PSEU|nr:acyltransferase [Pseudonocardia broussonetiae]QJY48991.1 acyltransferase [Pseudonocardia broussonetiae]
MKRPPARASALHRSVRHRVAARSRPGVAGGRSPHLDVLRTILVAWVIGGHALLGYSAVGGWAYDEVNEVTFNPASELVLVALLGPSGLFVIGVFFFVAGLVTERSLARRGPRRYLRDRVLRLGLPWLVSALLVWPASVWLAHAAAGRDVTFWDVLRGRDPLLDSGSLWFALVLLLYSVGLVLWRLVVRRAPHPPVRPLGLAHVAVAAAAVAVASFAVRLAFPARSGQVLDLHLWQWPQCLGMFALGVVVARHGWAEHVPDGVRRACSAATAVTLVLLPVLALAVGVRDLARDVTPFLGGWNAEALATATVEGILVVAGSVWLVGAAEHRFPVTGRRTRRWVAAAFTAFVVQGPVLMVLATAARPVPAPAEVKGPLLAAAAIVACFWIGGHLRIAPRRAPAARGGTPAGRPGAR